MVFIISCQRPDTLFVSIRVIIGKVHIFEVEATLTDKIKFNLIKHKDVDTIIFLCLTF